MKISIDRRSFVFSATALLGGLAGAPAALAEEGLGAAPALELYAKSPAVNQIALSPDGSRVGLITELKGKKYLAFFAMADMKATAVPIGNPKVLNLIWADNENLVFVVSKTVKAGETYRVDKVEQGSAYGFNIREQKPFPLFGGESNHVDLGCEPRIDRFVRDGKYVIYLNYNGESNYILGFTLADRSNFIVVRAEDYIDGWAVSPDGKTAWCSVFNAVDGVWELYNLKNPDENTRLVGPVLKIKSRDNSPELVGWAADGVSVVVSDIGEGGRDYFEVSPKGAKGAMLDTGASKIGRSPALHPKTHRLAGFIRHEEWIRYDYFDSILKQIAQAVPDNFDPGARWSFASFAEDPRRLLVYSEGTGDAGTYTFIDMTIGDAKFVSENYPDLPVEWIVEKQAIDYTAADGLKIHAYLTLPPGRKAAKLPLIVLPHGGPEARDYTDFDWQAQIFASRGYAVLQPNFRGSSGYGPDFVSAGYGEWGRKMQTDLSDGVRFLAARGDIDPARVAIVGASYGGYAALAGATLDHDVYRCAVSIAGVSDIDDLARYEKIKFGRNSSTVLYWKAFLGDTARWDAISPLKQVTGAYCPILLIHGKDDTIVPFDQSVAMQKALTKAGKTVEFVPFDGQDHWETNEASRVDMMKSVMAFVGKHNPV